MGSVSSKHDGFLLIYYTVERVWAKMAIYTVGDIQGCYHELEQMLKLIQFDKERDQLWLSATWSTAVLIHCLCSG